MPVDRYFPDLSSPELDNFLEYLSKKNLRMIFALENFSSSYFKELAPKLAQINIDFVEIDESHRSNIPGTSSGNWLWRYTKDMLE